MKAIILACAMLTFGISTWQDRQPDQNKSEEKKPEPTLTETVEWLSDKLRTFGGFTENKGDDTKVHKVEQAEFQSCNLTLKTVETSHLRMRPLVRTTFIYSFTLSDIDPSSIKVETEDNKPVVNMQTVDKKSAIKFDLKIIAPALNHNDSKRGYSLTLKFQDRDIAERVAKAFSHAVTLCKVKKEPF